MFSNGFRRFSTAVSRSLGSTTARVSSSSLVVAQRNMGGGGHHRTPTATEVALDKMFSWRVLSSVVGLVTTGYLSTKYWTIWQIRESDAFKTAMKAIQENSEVTELLGAPVTDSSWLTSTKNGGLRSYSFRVYGPKGSAWAYVSYKLHRKAFFIDTIMVEIPVPDAGRSQIVKPVLVCGTTKPLVTSPASSH